MSEISQHHRMALYSRQYYRRLRAKVLEKLGGKCAECGYNDPQVLQIDHIDGGGVKEIQKLGPARYKHYLETNCKGLQLLCANCNQKKKRQNREVPNLKYDDSPANFRFGHVGRPPNPNSKTAQIIVRAHENEKTKVRAFKEICKRNSIQIHDVVMDRVDQFLKEHNWPPGNSQTVLEAFGAAPQKECWRCHELFPTLTRVEYVSGLVKDSCQACIDRDRDKGLIKKIMRAV